MSFVCMNERGEFAIVSRVQGHGRERGHVRFTKDLDAATVFDNLAPLKGRDSASRDLALVLRNCIRVEAVVRRTVTLVTSEPGR